MSSTTHWDDFWQQGFITTFGGSLPDNYQGKVRSFWQEQFAALPIHAKVLDIATGNGAIALLARDYSNSHQKDFQIDACDSAVFPQADLEKSAVHFHSETPCEALPFGDGSFHLLTSQFGMEYSDLSRTLVEARRVLRRDGRLCAITHNCQSKLIGDSTVELAVYDQALGQVDIFKLVIRYLKLQNRPGKKALKKTLANEINTSINQLISDHNKHIAAREIVACLTSQIKAFSSVGVDEATSQLTVAAQNFTGARQRLKDMIAAALDREQADTVIGLAKINGFSTAEISEFCGDADEIIGWKLTLA